MAKPIESDPTLHGKTAKRFVRQYITHVKHDPDKAKRDKKALDVYQSMKVVS